MDRHTLHSKKEKERKEGERKKFNSKPNKCSWVSRLRVVKQMREKERE